MSTTEQRVAIVTGAARGIGAATAVTAGRRGPRRRRTRPRRGGLQGHRGEDHRGRRHGPRRRLRRLRRGAGGGRCRPRRRRARAHRPILVNNAGRAPRQPAVQDERVRLGHRDERAPARRVPDGAGRPEAHGRRQVRPDRQPLLQSPRSATAARPTTPPRRPVCRASPRPSPSSSASSASPPTPSPPASSSPR